MNSADLQLANPIAQPIKILVVDDLRVIREKLKLVLTAHPDLQIIGTATDGELAIEQLEYLQPDLILLDLDMPGFDGLQTLKIIAKSHPQIKVIIISSLDDRHQIDEAIAAGAQAYVLKDKIDLKIVDKIRAVCKDNLNFTANETNIVEFSKFTKGSISTNDRAPNFDADEDANSQFTQIAISKLHDWSDAAKELIDTLPLPWTRGLLYLLVGCIGVVIPWAFLYRMDEIGVARGRLEPQGNTIQREADTEGSVAVTKVYVKKGDRVRAGQTIVELDSKNIRERIAQNQLKLDGERQQLDRLLLLKNQVSLGTTAQQQQNRSQLLEKQTQIAQAQQNLSALAATARNQTAEKLAQLRQTQQTLADRQSSANLQQAEKLTQVRQAEQGESDAKTSLLIAQNRLKDARNEVNRYRKLYQRGAIAEVKVREIESIAQEKNQIFTQAVASLQQAKLRVREQRENYQKLRQQTKADIAQAKLRVQEQQENYQLNLDRVRSDLAQAKLRLTEQQRGSQSLTQGGNIAVLQTQRQTKELDSQIATLESERDRSRSQQNFLIGQLAKYTIKADTDGTIFELPIAREGAVVQPKQLIAEIAPESQTLIFKGEIPADRSESLRSTATQLDVKLKFDEFPFESYDVVTGKLTWIAPNSKLVQTTDRSMVASYEIHVQLDRACIKHESSCIPFKSGQPATAEIAIRKRRIIDFVLDPFKKLGDNNR
jgi:hemolysin D